MAFFGIDQPLEKDRPRGMFDRHDPFAGLAGNDDDEVVDFEQTYDGLGNRLEESGDTFNDDTFGGDEPVTRQGVGRDFDFAGQTAKVRDTLLEEQARQPRYRPPVQQPTKPSRTGYEAYKEPEYIPELEADASIWGPPKRPTVAEQPGRQDGSSGAGGRKMMTVEEVEAMMAAQAKPSPPPAPQQDADRDRQSQGLRDMLGVGGPAMQAPHQEPPRHPMQILQRPQQMPPLQMPAQMPPRHDAMLRQHSPMHQRPPSEEFYRRTPPVHQPQQGPPFPTAPMGPAGHMGGPPPRVLPPHARHQAHSRGPSYAGPPITQAQQMMSMTPQDREAYLAEEAKRAKRNHKIFLLSKNNGLMTPQDKNFITRIQLQQLLTATGGVDNEPGSEEQIAEDFYYQVYAQIHGAPPRNGASQPLNQFAQTYLFQTGNRYGYGRNRHHPRGGDNHVQRMEQQVARAVEAAKARPKNKQLVVEGSLGKIAFSNSKTPRPLLNLKRPDSEHKPRAPGKHTKFDRKTALRDIERLYTTLMKLEDHVRRRPPPPNEESPPEVIEEHMRWRTEMQRLNQALWEATRVMDPIEAEYVLVHFVHIYTS
jgi:DNA topoisomerase 2-associated protein PAT1